MKCPKCGYISFDNNQVCPKCNRDISYEQEKLSLPAFRPNPPSLLGALTGEVIESHVDMQIDQSYTDNVVTDIITEEDVNYEDSGVIDMGEVTFDDSGALAGGEVVFSDSQDLDVDLELGETTEFEAPKGLEPLPEEESVSDLDLDSLNDSTEIMIDKDESEPGKEEEISLDIKDFSDEEAESEGMAPVESADEKDEVSFGFEDLGLEESDSTSEPQVQELDEESEVSGINLDSMALEGPDSTGESQIEEEENEEPGIDLDSMALERDTKDADETELDLEDLQIDESGELEIRADSEPPAPADFMDSEETEETIDLENIDIELDLDEDDK